MARLPSADRMIASHNAPNAKCRVCGTPYKLNFNQPKLLGDSGELSFQLCPGCKAECSRLLLINSQIDTPEQALIHLQEQRSDDIKMRETFDTMVWQSEGGDSHSEPGSVSYSAKMLKKEQDKNPPFSWTAVFELLQDVKVWSTREIRFRKGDYVECTKGRTSYYWDMVRKVESFTPPPSPPTSLKDIF